MLSISHHSTDSAIIRQLTQRFQSNKSSLKAKSCLLILDILYARVADLQKTQFQFLYNSIVLRSGFVDFHFKIKSTSFISFTVVIHKSWVFRVNNLCVLCISKFLEKRLFWLFTLCVSRFALSHSKSQNMKFYF